MTASEVKRLLTSLKRTGKLPAALTESTVDAMSKSLGKYFDGISQKKIQEFTDKVQSVVERILKEKIGPSEARSQLTTFMEKHGAENIGETMNMEFFLKTAREVSEGAAQHIAQNWDQTRVDEFPA